MNLEMDALEGSKEECKMIEIEIDTKLIIVFFLMYILYIYVS